MKKKKENRLKFAAIDDVANYLFEIASFYKDIYLRKLILPLARECASKSQLK